MWKKVERPSVADEVVEQVKKQLVSGDIAVNEKLPNENKLAEMLGVSRATIREVLTILQVEGYIEIRRGVGAFAIDKEKFDRHKFIEWFRHNEFQIQELIEARIAIEPTAAYFACERIQEEELVELEKIHLDMKKAVEHYNVEHLIKGDEKFHDCILAACQNQFLSFMYSNMVPSLY